MPLNYTHLITEYDGDPSVFDPERRNWKAPTRTFVSKINSLPLMVHLPDFAPRAPENEASYDRAQKSVTEPEEWLSIGVRAGERFFIQDAALNSGRIYDRAKFIESHSGPTNLRFGGPAVVKYERRAELRHGLVEFRPLGFKADEDGNGRNTRLFFNEVDGGDVTFIKCHASGSPIENNHRNICSHSFVLYPAGHTSLAFEHSGKTLRSLLAARRKQ
ncbi:hypothetical protein ACIP1U_32225 [Cupriavidus sp. NPDC089707]|uniref:hypothetical protein n=1 Tax=Cupriavidus sp. NPDC089707 TaxID=3363963 RepID=UPI003814FF84